MASLKRDIASGLIVVAPVVITLIALVLLIEWIASFPGVAAIEPAYLRVPIVLGMFVVVVLAIGYLMRTTLGLYVEELITAIINRIPLLRVVYNASHLAIETVLRRAEGSVESVRVEAWSGIRVTAFTTGNRTDDDRLVCFFPTAPNITTGYVIEVEEEDVTWTGEGPERALTRLLSAGFGEPFERTGDGPPLKAGRTIERVTNVELPGNGNS